MLDAEIRGSENDSTIRLEGWLTREYVKQIRTVAARCKTSIRLVVDLTDVTLVDGEAVLLWSKHRNAEFLAKNSYAIDLCASLDLPLVG